MRIGNDHRHPRCFDSGKENVVGTRLRQAGTPANRSVTGTGGTAILHGVVAAHAVENDSKTRKVASGDTDQVTVILDGR
ncbi:hypothetical protein NYR55_07305 [Sphingomonas sp. BGYR3]|uniref:hypothetical protein n=1 Tax=Sphingomonas sp. BGYR3 TaxID=2975483 RepID=UPI0021A8BE23|nr:hypothetical protein [Sphingomonas sp. BGYR3]MDG5488427.1 hypothetical protein [Sphingomonas sp. BGYR3]